MNFIINLLFMLIAGVDQGLKYMGLAEGGQRDIFDNDIDGLRDNTKINRKESFENNVHEHNLLLLSQLIFKFGSPFYLSKRACND